VKSQILVTNFSSHTKHVISEKVGDLNTIWFHSPALSIDEVREIIKESYESSDHGKVIIIETKKLSSISQNGLLKVLEEPPKGVYFLIVVPSKSMILPTVRSRLSVELLKSPFQKTLEIEPLIILELTLDKLNQFLRRIEKISSEDAMLLLEQSLKKNRNYTLTEYDLERFAIAHKLLNLNSRPHRVFLMVFLPFLFANTHLEK
jgi:DNA polymerase-3 subunit delta'